MSRFLEAVFVLGCSLVGFGMSSSAGNAVQQIMAYAVHLVLAGCSGVFRVSLL